MICSSQNVDLYLNMVVMKDVLSFSVITFPVGLQWPPRLKLRKFWKPLSYIVTSVDYVTFIVGVPT